MATNKDKIRAAAQKYLQKGQIDKAIREFERLLEDDPNDVRTLLKIGDLQTRKGDQAAATKTYGNVAKYYSDQGFFLKAVAVYKQILKLDNSLVDVNLRLAELYHQLGLVSDAISQYRTICEIYEKAERWDDSLQVLNKMVELDPNNIPARIKLAELHARCGRVEEAKADFIKAADALKADNRLDDYIKVAERIVHVDPNDLVRTRDLASIYIQKNDARRALAKLQVCFRANPKDVETLNLLAHAFHELGQVQKAVSVYRELAEVHTSNGNHAARQGILRKIQALEPDAPADSRPEAAPPDADTIALPSADGLVSAVHEVHPDDEVPEADIEDAQLAEDEPNEIVALPESTPAPEAAPEDVSKMLVEADIYIKYGLRNKAIDHLERVLQLQPRHREAQERFKNVLLDADEISAATQLLWDMADSALEHGNVELARSDLAELLRHHPDHAAAREKLHELSVLPSIVPPGGPALDLSQEIPLQQEEGDELSVEIETESLDGTVSDMMHAAAAGDEVSADEISVEFESGDVDVEVDVDVDSNADAAPPAVADSFDDGGFEGEQTSQHAIPANLSAPRSVGVQLQAPTPSDMRGSRAAPSKPMDESLNALLADAVPHRPIPAPTTPTPRPSTAVAARAEPQIEISGFDDDIPPAATLDEAEEDELDLTSELQEITFFLEQELFDEAREAIDALATFYSDHRGVQAMQARLEQLAGGASPQVDIEVDQEPEPENVARLDADLEEELAAVPQEDDSAFEMSFEDVFDQFKKGVAEQVSSEDYDTHYNLGIAYKEMGLLEDAIREFELTTHSGQFEINALMMIGLCQLERGSTDEALKYFMQGLSSARVTPREVVALRYEVGLAYESMGRYADAMKFYEKASAMDPTFRDVSNRLSEAQSRLSDGPAASEGELDALLGDSPAPNRKSAKISYL